MLKAINLKLILSIVSPMLLLASIYTVTKIVPDRQILWGFISLKILCYFLIFIAYILFNRLIIEKDQIKPSIIYTLKFSGAVFGCTTIYLLFKHFIHQSDLQHSFIKQIVDFLYIPILVMIIVFFSSRLNKN